VKSTDGGLREVRKKDRNRRAGDNEDEKKEEKYHPI